jgi:hypothetical protein
MLWEMSSRRFRAVPGGRLGFVQIGTIIGSINGQAYFFGRTSRLLGEFLHLMGNNGEPSSGLTGASRFDGRIQREQIRLLGD